MGEQSQKFIAGVIYIRPLPKQIFDQEPPTIQQQGQKLIKIIAKMHKNSQVPSIKKQQIELIIANCYREKDQFLYLCEKMQEWSVLSYRDWSALIELNLRNCSLTVENCKIGLSNIEWPNLSKLKLNSSISPQPNQNQICSQTITNILTKKWPKLSLLNLHNNQIGDIGFISILNSPNIPALRQLYVGQNQIEWGGLVGLESQGFCRLSQLALSYNGIESKGVQLLIKACLPNLKKLWIKNCNIGNSGTKNLSKGNWPNLSCIGIADDNYITMDGYSALTINNWHNITYVRCQKIHNIQFMYMISTVWGRYITLFVQLQADGEYQAIMQNILCSRFVCEQ